MLSISLGSDEQEAPGAADASFDEDDDDTDEELGPFMYAAAVGMVVVAPAEDGVTSSSTFIELSSSFSGLLLDCASSPARTNFKLNRFCFECVLTFARGG